MSDLSFLYLLRYHRLFRVSLVTRDMFENNTRNLDGIARIRVLSFRPLPVNLRRLEEK